jgi:hypothetical protein
LLRSSISTSDTTPDRQLTSKKLDSLVFLMGLLHSASPQYRDEILPETLLAACNFPTENVSPESRSRFCDLWNQLVGDPATTTPASLILPNIRAVYNTLHGGTDDSPINQDLAPADYPPCADPTHPPDSHSALGATTTDVGQSSGEAPTVTMPQDVNTVAAN